MREMSHFGRNIVRHCYIEQIILARKNAAEPYSLFDETGKKILEFNPDFDGELLFDSIGYYMFRSGDKMMTVISNTGTGMCNIEINQDASFRFISGLIQITESNGTCRYYTVAGNSIFYVE